MRRTLVLAHRYVGLAIAGFLAIAGLTGSVIAFNHELDAWLNPEFYQASVGGQPAPLAELATAVERALPGATASGVSLAAEPGQPHVFWAVAHEDDTETYSQVFVDPVTGGILGARVFGACCFSAERLVPFLYVFHYSLALPDRWGAWLMGLVALFWFADCFVGAALTLPRARPILANWRPAFALKRGAGRYRRTLDLHRAGGLWPWLLLALLALSGVALNLQYELFRPALSLVAKLSPGPMEVGLPRFNPQPPPPGLGFQDALDRAEDLAGAAGEHGRALGAYRFAEFGAWLVTVGEDEHAPGLGPARFYLDDQTGAPLLTERPGRGTAGDLFLQLQFPLHSGQIAGLAGRIVIAVTGLVVAMLSVTGIIVWGYKRAGRRAARRHSPAMRQPAG